MGKPRITVEIKEDGGASGVVELFLNEEGLQLLLGELNALSKENDHFHLFASGWGMQDGPIKLKPYQENAATAGHLKVLFRPDEWDRKYFPEVIAAHQEEKCEGVDD